MCQERAKNKQSTGRAERGRKVTEVARTREGREENRGEKIRGEQKTTKQSPNNSGGYGRLGTAHSPRGKSVSAVRGRRDGSSNKGE